MIVVILMLDDHDDGAGVGLGDISGVNADGNVMSLKVRDRLYKRARHTEPTSKTADEHGIPILVRFPSLLSSKYGISTLVRFPSLLSAISARNQIGPCVYHGRHVAWWYMASIWSVLRGGPPPSLDLGILPGALPPTSPDLEFFRALSSSANKEMVSQEEGNEVRAWIWASVIHTWATSYRRYVISPTF